MVKDAKANLLPPLSFSSLPLCGFIPRRAGETTISNPDHRWRGQWALVTGASAGLGWEFARQLAIGGANLVLTARRRDRLEELARLTGAHDVAVKVFPCDLAEPRAPQALFDFTRAQGLPIELLVNNAGFGAYGDFHHQPVERLLEMVQVNCSAVVHLTHLFMEPMIARGHGDILMVSSVAAFQAIPRYAIYAATKVFELHFAEALAEELRPHGVRVSTLCPGTTATEFQRVAGSPAHPLRKPDRPEDVVRSGLAAMARGKSCKITGARYWMAVQSQRVMPRGAAPRIAARLYKDRA